MDLCNAKTFHEQVQWAFRIFDCDNSKSIAVDEFGESVKQVWKIFEGVGETKHNPGDCDKVNIAIGCSLSISFTLSVTFENYSK